MRVISLLALVMACAPARQPAPPVTAEPTPINASFARTWETVIDIIGEENIDIRTIDRASGFIAAERARALPTDTAHTDCGTAAGNQVFRPTTAKYNIIVRGDSSTSTVRTNVEWAYVHPAAPTLRRECSTRGTWERAVQERIKARAESR